jgi:hypothetical protein
MFQTLLLFLGYPAKKYVAGDVHAAQASSPHRVSNGQRRTRQLPKVKRRLSGGTGGPVSPMLREVGVGGLQWPVLRLNNLVAALERARENFAIARRSTTD